METKKETLLIVESDPIQLDLIRLALTRLDIEVISTADAAEAKKLAKSDHPAVIIVDTFLPHASGFDLVEEMRSEKLLMHTQVAMISAMGFEEIVNRAARMGIREFFVKPVDTDYLVKRVAALINN
jgi:DNA-binding response OmpR family regulator